MGKLVTTIFAETIIKAVERMNLFSSSIFIPDRFKDLWFECVRDDYEAKANECSLDVDGLWILNEPNHNKQRVKFLWRIEPNYCTAGRPSYSTDRVVEIFKSSETRKSVLKLAKSEICLEWFGFDSPTETCWGLRRKPVHITIYENSTQIYKGLPISERGWKKHLIEFVEEYYKWSGK